MDSRICTLETEYALVSNFLIGNPPGRDFVADQIESAIRADHVWVKCNSFGRTVRDRAGQNLVQLREGQFIENGSRVYYDAGHFEWANPETVDPRHAVLYEIAAQQNLVEAVQRVKQNLKAIQADAWIMLIKNNIDYVSNTSYGCHENYSLRRFDCQGREILEPLMENLIPFLVTRQIFCGSGRIGSWLPTENNPIGFQISQRSDFIEQITSPQTRANRSLINLRDEPLADKRQWRRLHLILGDSNMSEFANFLKLGTTSLVLSGIESNKLQSPWALREPVKALHVISREYQDARLQLYSGDWTTALTIQRWYWKVISQMIVDWPHTHFGHEVVHYWGQTLDDLEEKGERMFQRIDWAIKRRNLFDRILQDANTDWTELGYWSYLIKQTESIAPCPEDVSVQSWVEQNFQRSKFRHLDDYARLHRLDWRLLFSQRALLAKLCELDIRYHDIDPQQGLYALLSTTPEVVEHIIADKEEIRAAQRNPPRNTRAWQRGQLVRFTRDRGVELEMDWDKIMLTQTSQIIAMPDPFQTEQIDPNALSALGRRKTDQQDKKIEIKIVKIENLEGP